jgi:hypothetical protein
MLGQHYRRRATVVVAAISLVVAAVLVVLGAGGAGAAPVAQVIPPPAPTATSVPPPVTPPSVNVCPQIVKKVPAAAISDALSNPGRVGGYNQPVTPGKPESRANPLRVWLSIHVYAKPYHPLYNSLEFKPGCP